jgi:hypothetical protein
MAAGDITYDAGMPIRSGNRFVITGKLEADATRRTFAILDTKSTIVSHQLTVDDNSGDAPTTIQGIVNKDASDVATSGSIAVDAGAATDVRFRIEYI